MTELDTIKRAKMYIDKLANGINPLTGEVVPQEDIINNVRISRCLFYTSEVLQKVIAAGGFEKNAKPRLEAFHIDDDTLSHFNYSETPIPISHIANRINDLVPNHEMKKFSYTMFTKWLVYTGALEEYTRENGHKAKCPTELGKELGIFTELRTGANGEYQAVLYNKEAQQFLVDNFQRILQWNAEQQDMRKEHA